MSGVFRDLAEIPISVPSAARIYEHGWQSWSPAGVYPADLAVSPRPKRAIWQTMSFRPESPGPSTGFQGEGLLAVAPDGVDAPVTTFLAADPERTVPSIRAVMVDGRLVVSADGPVRELPVTPSLDAALASAGDHLAALVPPRPIEPLGPGWCSWYGHGPDVTDTVIDSAIATADREGLDIRIIQIDDGYQAAIGDWLESSGRIASMQDVAARIVDAGRTAGIWTSPFLVAETSRVAREHPDWLVGGAIAAERHWDDRIRVLDVTHPDAADHLSGVFRTLRDWGYRFHKIDFLYGGAMEGRRHGSADGVAAYRLGLDIIREAVGTDATILGCGAPMLPSMGLVDAMRVSSDTDYGLEPIEGDMSQPSMRSALRSGRARAWQHGRLWVNDPDCILVGPRSEDRTTWADHVAAYGGLNLSSDRLEDLDAYGLELTRRLLRPSSDRRLRWLPEAGPDFGTLAPAS